MPAANLSPYLEKWQLPECPADRLAYFAGFFDGEGCIQLHKTTSRNRAKNPEGGVGLSVIVVNTDRRPLDELNRYFGGIVREKVMSKFGWKPSFYWMIHGKRAAHFLAVICDSLVVKREQAEAALTFSETYFSGWRHCEQQGWPLTGEAIRLRRVSFSAFRAAMDRQLGRGISWAI